MLSVWPALPRLCAAHPGLTIEIRTGHGFLNLARGEADTNLLLCRLLERAGYTCQAALDGSGALELARTLRPSAILLDLMLPDMSGFDVCGDLRRRKSIRVS